MSERDSFDLSPQQYHAGLDKLWSALGCDGVQDEDVFTLAARRILQANAYEKALRSIVVHQQEIGGRLSILSPTVRMARKALET